MRRGPKPRNGYVMSAAERQRNKRRRDQKPIADKLVDEIMRRTKLTRRDVREQLRDELSRLTVRKLRQHLNTAKELRDVSETALADVFEG